MVLWGCDCLAEKKGVLQECPQTGDVVLGTSVQGVHDGVGVHHDSSWGQKLSLVVCADCEEEGGGLGVHGMWGDNDAGVDAQGVLDYSWEGAVQAWNRIQSALVGGGHPELGL